MHYLRRMARLKCHYYPFYPIPQCSYTTMTPTKTLPQIVQKSVPRAVETILATVFVEYQTESRGLLVDK